MYQCMLNVPLWNHWSKVTYSQVHGSPGLKTLSFKSLNWTYSTIFAELIQFGQGPKLRRHTYIYIYIYIYIYMTVKEKNILKIFRLMPSPVIQLFIYLCMRTKRTKSEMIFLNEFSWFVLVPLFWTITITFTAAKAKWVIFFLSSPWERGQICIKLMLYA